MDSYLGRKIKNDLINSYGVTVVPAGSVLNHEYIELLKKHKIDAIDMIFLSQAELDHLACGETVDQLVDLSKDIFSSFRISRKIPLLDIRTEVIPVVQQVSTNPDVFQMFDAIQGMDDYIHQHSIGVGILATLIGRWMNMGESDLAILSLAATLHDVGNLKIPTEILNKPGKLTEAEFAVVKKHTIYGYEMLKETTGVSSRIALVALQHHERNDGQGYPLGLKENKLDLFSKIVAVADVFHAMSSNRPYHAPIPFHIIVDQMRRESFGALDPHIVSLFLENIVNRTVGRTVVLTDGRVGQVVSLNLHDIETPLIKIDDEYIDLSKVSSLNIKEISI